MRVLLCPDKFRGTATARQAAEAIETGWRRIRPEDRLVLRPMADGGEGTLEALAGEGPIARVRVAGPLGDPVDAPLAVLADGTAVIEVATASGLVLLGDRRREPLHASTRGVGDLIRAALDRHARRILVCLGGSATNDAGAGMAVALGARFLDAAGMQVPDGGAALADVVRIDLTRIDPRLRATEVVGLCDVDNPLIGPRGASVVFGPQKGASPDDVWTLDRALSDLAAVASRDLGVDRSREPGAGAAGGLGFGLIAFCGARLRRGVDTVADAVGLDALIDDADLVVTGEGAFDETSLGGKVVGAVLTRATLAGTPAAVVCGRADVRPGGTDVTSLIDLVGPEAAVHDARRALETAGETLAVRAEILAGVGA
ncbi:MAG TPA: glycerate kinase [Actinomycetota bacterium]